jgi:hypothetical protein
LGLSRSYGAKGKGRVGRKQEWTGQRGSNGSNRGEKRDPEPAANTPKSSPNPDQTAEPSSPEPSEDHANPEGTTTEQEARRESEERIRGLLEAYQETLNTVEDLPAVVWVPWDRKGPGRYFKVPYLRLFLKYLEAAPIGWLLFALGGVQSDSTALPPLLDTYATRLLTQALSRVPHRQEPGYPQPPVPRDRCALQRP